MSIFIILVENKNVDVYGWLDTEIGFSLVHKKLVNDVPETRHTKM